MKGIITEFLNVRTKAASVNSPNPAFLKPGQVVEIVDIVNGDEYEGNNLWFQLIDGSYVWSGGIAGNRDIETKKPSKAKVLFNYNQLFSSIPDHVRESRGRGIKVAVLDTGFDIQHQSFIKKPKGLHNASGSSFGAKDIRGHGTHCCGLIAASNPDIEKGIVGIAPEVDLYISKVSNDANIFSIDNVVAGLKWAIEEVRADIINMSFSIFRWKESDKTEFNRLIKLARKNEQILVASAGENELLLTEFFTEFFYPAMCEEIIAIGAADKSIFQFERNFNSKLDFFMCFRDIYSTVPPDTFDVNKGSSMAAAMFSALTSLFLSSKKTTQKNNYDYIRESFQSVSFPLTSINDLNSFYKIYKP